MNEFTEPPKAPGPVEPTEDDIGRAARLCYVALPVSSDSVHYPWILRVATHFAEAREAEREKWARVLRSWASAGVDGDEKRSDNTQTPEYWGALEYAADVIDDDNDNPFPVCKALDPSEPPKSNAGVTCDMERGPCACGAWH